MLSTRFIGRRIRIKFGAWSSQFGEWLKVNFQMLTFALAKSSLLFALPFIENGTTVIYIACTCVHSNIG